MSDNKLFAVWGVCACVFLLCVILGGGYRDIRLAEIKAKACSCGAAK